MFNSICLLKQHIYNSIGYINFGFLAEAMLFYDQVHLIADEPMLDQIIRYCGPDLVLEFIEEKFLKISYLSNHLYVVCSKDSTNQSPTYSPTCLTKLGKGALQEILPNMCQDVVGKSGKGRRLGNRLLKDISQIDLEKIKIYNDIRTDYANKNYVKKSIRQILQILAPEYKIPPHFRFDIKAENGNMLDQETPLLVDTNLDFVSSASDSHLKTSKGITDITPSLLLQWLYFAKSDLYISSLYESEIATNFISSAIIRTKCEELLGSRFQNEHRIRYFQDKLLNNGHALQEAINSGERNYGDLLKILRLSRRFRQWLKDQDPNIDLVQAYYKEVTSSTWIEKLPSKVLKWTTLAAIDAVLSLAQINPAIGIATSTVLSFADSFVIEKMARGWKPNQFVERHLQSFVKQTSR